MLCYVIYIFFAFSIGAWANFGNIQMTTCDDESSCTDTVNLNPFVKIGTEFYYINNKDKYSWFEATEICRTKGADLATIDSGREMEAISEYLRREGYKGEDQFWLSYTNLGTNGSYYSMATGDLMTYSYWGSNQPANIYTKGFCVSIASKEGTFKMYDILCNSSIFLICQLDTPRMITLTIW